MRTWASEADSSRPHDRIETFVSGGEKDAPDDAGKIEEKGRREALLQGKRDALLQLLTAKFGPLPKKTASRISAIRSVKEVERHLGRVLEATSLAAMGLKAVRRRDIGAPKTGSTASRAGSTHRRTKRSRGRYREVAKMYFSYIAKLTGEGRLEGWHAGRKEGREEGRQAGLRRGKRKALERQLTTKFGPIAEEIRSRVRALDSLEELDRYLERVLVATSLAAMELGTGETAATSDRAKRTKKRFPKVDMRGLSRPDQLKEKGRREGWREGRRRGRWEGVEEGLVDGKCNALEQQLTAKFGRPLEKKVSRILGRASIDDLDRYLDRVLVASSLDEMDFRERSEPPIFQTYVRSLPLTQ